ncbi:Sarcolemmal membrane-associated protein [Acipenser ruthenus]|uniref:Sarcolemmal membrane-associated protein n=1 Tax=Acipenser ruthenus TaxID=7906 RepID=A0A444V4T4_ACIRT|nr:Sarcolemmal membrane-associated protein [Acipenser ruthenus]
MERYTRFYCPCCPCQPGLSLEECFKSVIQAPVPLPVDKEALHREQMLEQKLATLQRLLASTQEASESSWQNQTEDGIRKELIALQEDKHNYETTAKESLRRVLQEKIEVVRKLSEVEVRNTACL